MDVYDHALDKRQLWHVIVRLIGIPPAQCRTHEVTVAVRDNGVRTFVSDLLTMSADNIMSIQGTAGPVPLTINRKLVIAVACYHHYS